MKKNSLDGIDHYWLILKKALFVMKLTILIILISSLSIFANKIYSQNTRISLNRSNTSVKEVLREIENNSEFFFIYNNQLVDVERVVDIDVDDQNIYAILDELFNDSGVEYVVKDKHIILTNVGENKKNSQSKPVKGKVSSESGEPIPGATVYVKGTSMGTITDINGEYSIPSASADQILVFSFIGYKTKEIAVNNNNVINVVISEDAIGLEEVVAIGYGVQKKKLVTGSTIQVDGESLSKRNSVDALGALQSLAPGVNIVQRSGQPGEGYKINIRGLGTTGSSDPLVVIDGVAGGSLEALNQSDIESIDILKDAASSAIYGARAANGVILVTTRKGKAGNFVVSYDGYTGVQNASTNGIETLNAKQYMEIVNSTLVSSGAKEYNFKTLVPNHYQSIMDGSWNGTNWLEESKNNNAPINNHSVNISGGSDMSRVAMGFSYLGQEGTIGKSAVPKFERYTVHLNSDHTLLRKNDRAIITFGENVTFTSSNKSGLNIGGIYNNNVRDLLIASPLLPAYNTDGDFFVYKDMVATGWDFDQRLVNPLAKISVNHSQKNTNTRRLQANAFVEIAPVKELKFRSNAGYQFFHSDYRRYVPVYELSSDNSNLTDDITQTQSYSTKWTWENTLNFVTSINKHHIDLLVGQSVEKWGYGNELSITNSNSLFPGSFDHAYINNSQGLNTTDTRISGSPNIAGGLASFFGRVNYNYNETYMASLVMRADGSSNFARGHRWGYFPSLSAGWVMTNEEFMKPATGLMNFLKVRANWGQNGNADIDNFQYLATIAFNSDSYYYFNDKNDPSIGAYPDILPNENVTWETSEQLDLGFDAHFFNSQLTLTFDWYNKTTKDWLVVAPQLASYGTGAPFINGGDVENKGFEIALSLNKSIDKFKYSAGLSLANNNNKVTRIANEEGIIHGAENVLAQNTDELYRVEVGYPMGYFWGYKTAGVFQNQAQINQFFKDGGIALQDSVVPGDLIFVNDNGDEVIDDEDKVMIGNPHPKFTMGFNFNCSYKGIDLSVNAYGAFGHQIAKCYREFSNSPNNNYTNEVYTKYWTGEGSTNRYPAFTHGKNTNFKELSDLYIEDGDYVKISNISIGYDLKSVIKKLPLQKLRIYITAQNLFTFTKYSGFDPEVGYGNSESWASGIDIGYYPSPKTILGGINIVF
ncbi:MAG: TonB-dependent receptor [Prolixibacteraceae bacterium]|nr:TonB-dependent receptor [Prolixibacteraceae bacterium]